MSRRRSPKRADLAGVLAAALLLGGCTTTSNPQEPRVTGTSEKQIVLTEQVAAEQRVRTRTLATQVLTATATGALAEFGATSLLPDGAWVGCLDDGKGYKYSASARFDLSTGSPADAVAAVADSLTQDGWRPQPGADDEEPAFTRDDHVATVFPGRDGRYILMDVDGPCGVVEGDAPSGLPDGGSEDLPLPGVPTSPVAPPTT
ncbi:hypothetical protein [Solicola sp. PLA-1-18]|uniref:hypothetical protein n=1 Tax=Solicola sp. PLA-1-18 TaxID=3380532 RepID=UPI003B767666